MAIVYQVKNKKNGKRYIGATSYPLVRRRYNHEHAAMNNPKKGARLLCAAMNKYGFNAFEWTILESFETLEEALRVEIELIESMKPEYNITIGGTGIIGVPRTIEWIKNMGHVRPVICANDGIEYYSGREASRVYGISPMRICQLCRDGGQTASGLQFMYKGETSPRIKKQRSAKEIRDAAAKRKKGLLKAREACCKQVLCDTDGLVYPSITAAAKANGIHLSSLSDAIYRNGTAGGKKYSFVDKENR